MNFCSSCGTPRTSPDQRFCAGCGAALAAPETPAATLAPAPYAPPPAHAPPPAYQPPPAYVAPPTFATPPPASGPVDYAVPQQLPLVPDRGGRRAPVGKILGIGTLVLALVGAGIVAWAVLRPSGGAETPEAAVEQFLEAVMAQDPVGALEMVNPGEVDGLDEVYEAARDRLEEEGLVEGDGLSDAVDIELTDLDFDVRELSDEAARVVLTDGDYRVTFDPDRLPDRLAFLAEAYPDGESARGDLVGELAYELPDIDEENDESEPFVTTVKIDGRWYLTAFGTVMDAILADSINFDFDGYDLSEPDYSEIADAPDPIVGDDAADVLDNLAAAVNDSDVAELLANLPADQVSALRPYARTWEDVFTEQGLDFQVDVTDLDLETDEEDDGLLRVTVDRAYLLGTMTVDDDEDRSASLQVDGRCFVASTDYDHDEECLGDEFVDGTGIDSVVLMLREVDGGYQLDPLATAAAYASTVVDSVPTSLVDELLLEVRSEVSDECDYVEDGQLVSCE